MWRTISLEGICSVNMLEMTLPASMSSSGGRRQYGVSELPVVTWKEAGIESRRGPWSRSEFDMIVSYCFVRSKH